MSMKKRGILPVAAAPLTNAPPSPLVHCHSTGSSSCSSFEGDIESPQRRRTVLSVEQTNFRRECSINCSSDDDDDDPLPRVTFRFDTDAVTLQHGHHKNDLDALSTHSERSLKPADLLAITTKPKLRTKAMQLTIGVVGIYSSFLYYGLVHEDLYRYVGPSGERFALVWSHQILESLLAAWIGYVGRTYWTSRSTTTAQTSATVGPKPSSAPTASSMSLTPFIQMGLTQLAAKTLISLSLEVGVSYPVLTVAKSAKIVPVMMGQFVLGGSSYSMRDYIFAILIVVGTALLSAGQYHAPLPTAHSGSTADSTTTGLALIFLSLSADGLTGGIQKKLQRSAAPTAYDLLYYSHLTQLVTALVVCVVMGEMWTVPTFFRANPAVLWLFLASSVSTAVGQCFIFYVISHFDPLICTTVTTTRKMLTVLLSISFKGHDLTGVGSFGLALACAALLVELEGKVKTYRSNHYGTIPPLRLTDR